MKTKVKPKADAKWIQLRKFITNYVEAYEADSWKGGGDPDAVEVIEARLRVAELELEHHIAKMRRELEPS